MWLLGYTLNLMTLLAMSLISGFWLMMPLWCSKTFNATSIWVKKNAQHQWMAEWRLVFQHFQLLWLM